VHRLPDAGHDGDSGISPYSQARKELAATGETARKPPVETVKELIAQEPQIARLARTGHSNFEISTQLFISPRTVEWHLGRVFTKLGISSWRELRAALPDLYLVPVSA
jgi:DNA-binding CsgD family transcriptional regulator